MTYTMDSDCFSDSRPPSDHPYEMVTALDESDTLQEILLHQREFGMMMRQLLQQFDDLRCGQLPFQTSLQTMGISKEPGSAPQTLQKLRSSGMSMENINESPTTMRTDGVGMSTSNSLTVDEQVSDLSSAVTGLRSVITVGEGGALHTEVPNGWPGSVAPRTEQVNNQQGKTSTRMDLEDLDLCAAVIRHSSAKDASMQTAGSGHAAKQLSVLQVFHPSSTFRMIWDVCSVWVLAYDMALLPYIVAGFATTSRGWIVVMSYITMSFWSIDMFLCFRTGFYSAGKLQMGSLAAARHYLKTWFLPDLLAVSSDWFRVVMMMMMAGDVEDNNLIGFTAFRVAKMSRLLRIMGLFRLIRRFHFIDDFMERTASDTAKMGLHVGQLFVGILWLNHVFACVWYLVGVSMPSDTSDRWVDQAFATPNQSGEMYKYFTCLHWAMSQITPGSMEVRPTNSSERAVNVCYLGFGLVFVSGLVSSMSATMIRIQAIGQDKTKQMRTLRRFLRQNNIGPKIAVLVQKQVTDRMGRVRQLTAKDVHVLQLLASSLRVDLHTEMCERHLEMHPMFRLAFTLNRETMRQAAFASMKIFHLPPHEDLFVPGNEAPETYALIQGQLRYVQTPASALVLKRQKHFVNPGTWICEAALFCHWQHMGTASACFGEDCHLLCINAKAFLGNIQRHYLLREFMEEYILLYHFRVTMSGPPQSAWPSDLLVPFSDYIDMVGSMKRGMQSVIGLLAIQQLRESLWWSKLGAYAIPCELEEEVEKGQCLVVQSGLGDVERLVLVAAVCIYRSDRRLLVRLGKLVRKDGAQGSLTADCKLPGAKQDLGEQVDQAIEQILSSELEPLRAQIEMGTRMREEETKESKRYRIKTRYSKTVQYAYLRDADDNAGVSLAMQEELPRRRNSIPSSMRTTSHSETARELTQALDSCDCFILNPVDAAHSGDSTTYIYGWLKDADLKHLGNGLFDGFLAQWLEQYVRDHELTVLDFENVVVSSAWS